MYPSLEMGGGAPMDMDVNMKITGDPMDMDIILEQGGRAPMDMDATAARGNRVPKDVFTLAPTK